MAFEEYDKLVKFLNDENININEWWNEKKIQILRKSYLKNFFNIPNSWETKWLKYVKKTKKYN